MKRKQPRPRFERGSPIPFHLIPSFIFFFKTARKKEGKNYNSFFSHLNISILTSYHLIISCKGLAQKQLTTRLNLTLDWPFLPLGHLKMSGNMWNLSNALIVPLIFIVLRLYLLCHNSIEHCFHETFLIFCSFVYLDVKMFRPAVRGVTKIHQS